MCIRDRLYAIQLFGCEPEALEKAILLVREKGIRFDILDINMGCPAPKITNSGAGSKLLLDPPLCGRMVAAARRALGEDTPLTVKMRIGWDAEHLTGVEVAKQCEANGADLIAVHGRTREQMYVPPIDAGAIAAIKQAVSIPVLANGDITTAEGALTLDVYKRQVRSFTHGANTTQKAVPCALRPCRGPHPRGF